MARIMLDIMIIAVVYLAGYKMGVHQSDRMWEQSLDKAVKETIEKYIEKENKK